MIARIWTVLMLVAFCAPIAANAQTANDLSDQVHSEQFAIRLDGVVVADNATVYLSDDDTIYVSSAQLDAWNLKRPLNAAFDRDGSSYYALQSDLNLAASFDRSSRELDIVARRSAFLGQPKSLPPLITQGSGAALNYTLKKENQSYNLYSSAGSGIFEMRYISTTGDDGLEFHRSRTRWFRLNAANHTLLQLGDGTTNGGALGNNAPFAGIRWASDYSSDPTYVPSGPPSVSGIATAPSLLEVYVDNVLELRQDVAQGPFTVRDLPASAAHSDIVMLLTDINGNKTLQVARPSYDPEFLGKNQKTFGVDAGLGHNNVDLVGSYYRGGVFDGMFRYGLTNRITAEIYAESINSENFADAGADMALGENQRFTFRIGAGNKRLSSQYEYNLRANKLRFRTQLSFNSLQSEPFFGEDFGNTISEIAESSELSYDMSRNLSFTASLNRRRSNNGSDSSMFSLRTRYRKGAITLDLNPLYDFVSRRPSANLTLIFRASDNTRISQRGAVTARGQQSGSIEYQKDAANPSDPISYSARIAAGRGQDRRLYISDEMRWANATFNYQNLGGINIYEPEIYGALAFAGRRIYPVRTVGDNEAFGVLHLPGLRHVRVSVNSSDIGATDSHGDLVLRNLQAFRDNVIVASTQDLPIDVNVIDPQHVVPVANSPVFVVIPIVSRGGFTLTVFDNRGMPLDPGSQLQGQTGSAYLIGYNGRAYVTGVEPGTQTFTGTADGVPCQFEITVPANTETIPDLGRRICVVKGSAPGSRI